jgi:hypothetical protein
MAKRIENRFKKKSNFDKKKKISHNFFIKTIGRLINPSKKAGETFKNLENINNHFSSTRLGMEGLEPSRVSLCNGF